MLGGQSKPREQGPRLPHRVEQSRAWDWCRESHGTLLRSRLRLLPSLGVTHRLMSVLAFVTPTKPPFLNNRISLWLMPATELLLTELQTGFYLKSIK